MDEPVGTQRARGRHLLALGGAVLAVSSAAILARECDAPPATIALYRMGLTTLFLLIPLLPRGRRAFADLDRRGLFLIVVCGVLLGAHYVMWFTSLKLTTVASSALLVSTHPLTVALLSGLIAREKVSGRALGAVTLATVGACLIAVTDLELSTDHLVGDALALLAGILFALYFLAGRVLRRTLDLGPFMVAVYGVATVTVGIYCLAAGVAVTGFAPRTYLGFLALAAIPTVVGHSLFNWALRYVKAHIVSLSQLGEPIGATVLAWILLEESPAGPFYPAAILTLTGIFLLLAFERKSFGAGEEDGESP